MQLYIYTVTAVFGLCIGSFLNVVIYRLPKGTFFANARSLCPSCGRQLSWFDLIPVFSWLALRGQCRTCKANISPRYLIVELSAAGLAVGSLWRFGYTALSPLAFGALAILLAVALIDLDTMEIPDALVIALTPLAIAAIWAQPDVSWLSRVIGFFAVSLPMLGLTKLTDVWMGKEAFGGGDVKLIAVCGFLLGWQCVLAAMFIAILTGGGLSVYLLASGKSQRGAHIPFGPHLCFGVAAALFWGRQAIDLYLGLFGI